MSNAINIFWFRRDLRLHDNTGLYYALKDNYPVLPIFIFDSDILNDLKNRRDARVNFIYNELQAIKKQLEENGSTIKIMHGKPIDVFKYLLQGHTINSVFTNRDYEPYAKARDQQVNALLQEKGANLFTFKDHVVFEEGEILTDNNQPYKVFTPYKNKWLSHFEALPLPYYDAEKHLKNLLTCDPVPSPSLEEIGFKPSSIPIPGRKIPGQVIKKYHEQRNFPGENSTSRLGIHLRHGTVSIRETARQAQELSSTWLNELIWRDFYSMVLAHNPQVIDTSFKPGYDKIPWVNDEGHFQKWCDGKTGYPIVDAGMRELNETGYMHNRVRMITASFLTKHLLIDWRWGEAYFAEKLLDYELASNNGGWQWAAGTGTDAQPYFRVFNPYTQADKFDKARKYIRYWVPEVDSGDYPAPIVPHKAAREKAIDTYKNALQGK